MSEAISEEKKQYKRFCSVCHRTIYEWFCCGKRTRRLNLQVTLKEKFVEKRKHDT